MHVSDDGIKRGRRPQATEYTARSERIADRLIESILAWDLDIVGIGLKPTDLEGDHDEVGAFQRLTAIRGRRYRRRQAMSSDQSPGVTVGTREVLGRDVHQREVRVTQSGKREHVAYQRQREDVAPRTDDCDFGHE